MLQTINNAIGPWDQRLAYSTVKVAKIRDWRLGLFHRLLQLAILLYLIIDVFILKAGHQAKEPVQQGSLRVNARSPGKFGVYPYCCSGASCPVGDLSQLPCAYMDSIEAVYPSHADNSLSITSRTTVSLEARGPGCGEVALSTDCMVKEVNRTVFYTAGLEDFTIRILHGVAAESIKVSGINTGMVGRLVDEDGATVRQWPTTTNFMGLSQGTERVGDLFTVGELLQLAHVDLNKVSRFTGDPLRYDGVTLVVYITYSVHDLKRGVLGYVYNVRSLSEAEFKVESASDALVSSSRVKLNRHGVRLIFVQKGEVGVFSFQNLLISLVAASALLTVAATISDICATKFLHFREEYKAVKYQESQPMSALWEKRIAEGGGFFGSGSSTDDDDNIKKKKESGTIPDKTPAGAESRAPSGIEATKSVPVTPHSPGGHNAEQSDPRQTSSPLEAQQHLEDSGDQSRALAHPRDYELETSSFSFDTGSTYSEEFQPVKH